MKRHFKLVLLPAAVLDIRSVATDCKGPDEDYFNERDVELDSPVLTNRTIHAREIEFVSSDTPDLLDKVVEICHRSQLDPEWLDALLQEAECDALEEADGSQANEPVWRRVWVSKPRNL